jgi:hypothetical protein
MGLACFWFYYSEGEWGLRAAKLLTQIKPDWRKKEVLTDPDFDLAKIRRKLGLEI